MSRTIEIEYHRPPDRSNTYIQEVLYEDEAVIVSMIEAAVRNQPAVIDGKIALEAGSPIIWFVFPGLKYDIGRFHTADGRPTGTYADIIKPLVRRSDAKLEIVDLFVDVWIADGAPPTIQDVDELEHAVRQGWIDRVTADEALREAERLVAEHAQGSWPPAIVNEWPISRVRGTHEN